MKKHTIDLTTGPITKKLITFAFPLLVANMLQVLYQAADNAVVGQFAGKVALAAVGATGAATNLILNIILGLAIGANIVNANLRGSKNEKDLRKSLHTTVAISVAGGVLFSLLGQILCRPLLVAMNCPDNVIDLSVLYMRIIFCGTPGTMVYNFGAGILRTYGDSKRPMVIMAVSGVVNVVLNLVFVICFKMTVDGVALATIISKYVAAVWVVIILFNPNDEYKLKLREIKLHAKETTNIVKVGIPCGINSTVFSLSNVIVSAGINAFGDTVIAGGVASNNITTILYSVIGSFYSACVSFVGQCYGAGKYKRIDGVFARSCGICTACIFAAAVVITIRPDWFISIFNTEPDVIAMGIPKLVIISWSYILYSVSDITIGCLRGMKKSAAPTIINILTICVSRVLWVCLVAPLDATNPVLLYWCYPTSYILSTVTLLWYYAICRREINKKAALLNA